MMRLPHSELFHRLGEDRILDKLPIVDKQIVLAHIAGQLGIREEQSEFIRRVIMYRKRQRVPSPASLNERIENEPRAHREELRAAEAETKRFGRDDIPAAMHDEYLGRRVELANEILGLSCFQPYYSQFQALHDFGSNSAIYQLGRIASSDDVTAFFRSKKPTKIERRVIYVAALSDLILLAEKAAMHKQIGELPETERIGHVYGPALVYFMRMAAEYSVSEKMPIGRSVGETEKELSAKIALVSALAGENPVPHAASIALDICLSNGDYDQGIKIAQTHEIAELVVILKNLKQLMGSDFVEAPRG
jgi:hypothetical protein